MAYFGGYFHDSHIWLALEFCAGGSLIDIVETQGAFGEMELRIVARKIAEGIQELHKAQLVPKLLYFLKFFFLDRKFLFERKISIFPYLTSHIFVRNSKCFVRIQKGTC